MWGGALDPEPRAPPAAAPYPDAQYAMTASEFDARLETWGASAHDGSFDAQITESFAFRELTRHREIRAAGAFAFAALFPLTASVFHTFAALPFPESSFDTDPVTHAMALRGGCDVQSGEVEKVRQVGADNKFSDPKNPDEQKKNGASISPWVHAHIGLARLGIGEDAFGRPLRDAVADGRTLNLSLIDGGRMTFTVRAT